MKDLASLLEQLRFLRDVSESTADADTDDEATFIPVSVEEFDAALDEAIAALAAPKEDGDDFEALITSLYGDLCDKPIELSHAYAERIRRLAAPSKEAGQCPHCDGPPKTYFKDYVPCRHCKGSGRFNGVTEAPASAFRNGNNTLVACPDASPKRQVANPADSTPLAAKPSDQQGASLEGEHWLDSTGEPGSLDRFGWRRNEDGLDLIAQVLQLAVSVSHRGWHDDEIMLVHVAKQLASKASPDDQRQEGVALPPRRQASDYIADTYGPADLAAIWNACRSETSRLNSASPPTEAAAAVGEKDGAR